MDNSKKVCDFYAKNKSCRNGTKCKFLHTDSGPQTAAASKPETSKKASRGKGKANKANNPGNSGKSTGNQGANQAKSPKPSTPAPAPSLAAAVVKSAPKPEPSPAWDSPSYGATSGSSVVTKLPTSNGRDLAETNEETPRPSPSVALRSPQSDQPVKKSNKTCVHYKRGSCWMGDKCPHVHDNTAVAASPAPSTLSELVMSPSVGFDKFTLTPDSDRKGKAPVRSASWASNSPKPANGNAVQAQQRSAIISSIQDRAAARSTPAPSPAPIPPQTPSFQFKPAITSWSYDSDEEEEAIVGVKRTPEVPTATSTLEHGTAYPSPSQTVSTPASAPSPVPAPAPPPPPPPAPAPEEVDSAHETTPASTQSTPLQQTFELGEESAVPATEDFGIDLPRDEAGPLVDSVDPILSQNGNGHATEDAGKEADPAEGIEVDEPQSVSPLPTAASVTEEEEDEEDEYHAEVVEGRRLEVQDGAEKDETRDVNDLGTSSRFDWSAEVEENGVFGDTKATTDDDDDDEDDIIETSTPTALNDENDIASPASLKSLDGELPAERQDVNNDIGYYPTVESKDGTKLDFDLENREREGPPLDDTFFPDEHEIDQRDSAENEATTQHEQSRIGTPLPNLSNPSPTYYSPSSSPSSSESSVPVLQHDPHPSIPVSSPPPPAIVDRLDDPIIPTATPPINSPKQVSSVWAPPAPQVTQMASTSNGYGQFASPADATAANVVNQLQVANSAPALPPSSSTSAAVVQQGLLQQPYNPVLQQQQAAYQPYQNLQPQVQQQATFAPPFNLQYPYLQMPQMGFQPLVAPMVMQPIIQQQPIYAPYIQSTPMYNPPLTPYNQSFGQQQQQQQQHSPHWTQFADPQARNDVPFCKLLAQGNCPSGNACTYRHALTIQEFTLLFHDRQPALFTINQTHPWHRQAPPQAHNAPAIAPQVVNYSQSFSHTATQSIAAMPHSQPAAQLVAPAQPPKTQVCHFYPLNRCTNGDNCPYLHVQSDPQYPSSSNSDKPNWGKSGSSGSRSRVPCKFFFSPNRRCDNSQCTFSHDQADAPVVTSDPPDFQEDPVTEKVEETADDSGWGKPTDWEASGWGTTSAEQTKPADISAWDTTTTEQPAQSSSNKVDNNDNNNSGRPSKPEYVNGKKRCMHFQRGSCWKGDNCKFAHDGESNGNSSNGDSPRGGPAQTRTPQSQTSSESRSPSVVDDAKPGTNLDNFGQATRDEGSSGGGAFDAWGGDDDDAQEHGVEEVVDNDVVEESQGELYESNGANEGGEQEEEVEKGQEQVEESPEHEEEMENGVADEAVDDEESLEEGPITFHHPAKDYSLWNSVVRFGPDITPDNVLTSAESRTIIISNLPRLVPIPDVRRLVDAHGQIRDIRVAQDFAGSTSIQVDFADVTQAMSAFVHLNTHTFQERQLGARLKSRSPVTARMPALRCSIKVNWPLPSVTAFCYYPTITAAKQEVERLEGTEIKGRVISVIFDSPRKNKKDNFVMNISDLPPDITVADLESICQGKPHVVLSPPSYEGDVTEEVKLLVHECGEMDTFEVMPFAPTHKKFTAFATFTSEAAADRAIKRLHGTSPKFLKEKPLQVRAMYYARYRVEDARFKVLEKSLQDIQNEGNCQVHWSTSDGAEGIVLRILAPGDKGSCFQEVSAAVLKLLEGRVVRNEDGQTLWHEYFETSSSSKLLNRLSTEFPILIHCNQHARHLKMIGSSDIQDQVESRILKTLDKPIRNSTKRLRVSKAQTGALINGLLEDLQSREEIGTSKFVLDATEGILTLWGGKSSNADEIVAAALKDADIQQVADGSKVKARCQVCGLASVQPIQLSCRHSYCRNCLTFVIRNTPQTPILCLGKDKYGTRCFSFVPFIMVRELIPSDEKDFLRSCLASYVGRSTDFFFCPTLDCEAIYRTGEPGLMIKCSRCRCDLCPSCKTWSHVGLDCAAVQQNLHSTADIS